MKKTKDVACVLLAGLALTIGVLGTGHLAADPTYTTPPANTPCIDALFARFDHGAQPGAAVLVMRGGEVVHERGYGLANLKTGERITPRSAFRLASVSKQFTAMAVAMLADQGKIGLDDPIRKYISDLVAYPGVTVRHLLTHTSGVPDYYDTFDPSPWIERGEMPANADAMAYLGRMDEPLFAPGERYEYSNPGYEALAQAVENASGQSFAGFMRERLFVPIGMSASLIHDHTRPDIENRVIGYRPKDDGGFERYDEDPLNGLTGSGGQYSTLEDFVAWERALADGALLSPAMREQVFTRAVLNDGSEIDYGFGWRLDTYRGHQRIAHGGSWVGFRTAIARYPGLGLTVVILSNRSDYEPSEAAERVIDVFLQHPSLQR